MMQKIDSESNGPHVLLMELAKQKYRKKNFTKSTDVVLAKYPPKIKLEREFLQL